MELPTIVINFKTYENATGQQALLLAQKIQQAAEETQTLDKIIIAPQATDIRLLSEKTSLKIYAQHIDPKTYGSNTGHIIPEAVKQAGATGTLINHSEHQISLEQIKQTNQIAKQLGLETIICANTPQTAAEIVKQCTPDAVAVEPPELIGGNTSVSTAKPEIITNTVQLVHKEKKTPVLCGAGVKNAQDVAKAIQLGSQGILLASGVTKASDPKQVMLDLIQGLG